jgi:putative glutamine amidotransferase
VTKHTAMGTHDSAPLVGVTATTVRDAGIQRARLNMAYVRAVAAAGMVPVLLAPIPGELAHSVVSRLDGLVLTGGEDVDPALFGATPHDRLGAVNRERDDWELALLEAARELRTPTLAICRGIQLLNVAFGGTLYQDIPSELPESLDHDASSDSRGLPTHEVRVEHGSRLQAALGSDRVMVNSIHHQALDEVAPALHVTARSEDGLIEGVEAVDGGWWVLGVQWHPEELVDTADQPHQRLFAAFAAELKRNRG